MTDLDKLIEAVEVDAGLSGLQVGSFDNHCTENIVDAYYGSLDAAKALHEALLPDTRYLVGGDNYDWPENTGAIVFATPKQVGIVAGNNPARAWLIAILKAHRSLQ